MALAIVYRKPLASHSVYVCSASHDGYYKLSAIRARSFFFLALLYARKREREREERFNRVSGKHRSFLSTAAAERSPAE